MTAHPMGGAAIADTPARGVADHRGEVFGCPRLYVADGAAYPAPPGVPPSLTIAALAERQAELLASEAGRG
jgi:cholesterol oxidase